MGSLKFIHAVYGYTTARWYEMLTQIETGQGGGLTPPGSRGTAAVKMSGSVFSRTLDYAEPGSSLITLWKFTVAQNGRK